MRIILVPDNTGRRYNTSLSHRHVLLIGIVALIIVPLVIGSLAYRFAAGLDRLAGGSVPAAREMPSESPGAVADGDVGIVQDFAPARSPVAVGAMDAAGLDPERQEPGLAAPEADLAIASATEDDGGPDATPLIPSSGVSATSVPADYDIVRVQAPPAAAELARLEPELAGTTEIAVQSEPEPVPLGAMDARQIDALQEDLRRQRETIDDATRNARNHLDALGLRLGRIQAQLVRINALGQRLTEMAGLDEDEFNFVEEPAIGGPEMQSSLQDTAGTDLNRALEELAREVETKYEQLAVLESLLMDRQLQKALYPAGWPVQGGWISSGYGYRKDPFTGRRAFHGGVDIANKPGTPIKAMAAGVITHAGVKAGYGLMVEINHGNGYATRYAHSLATLVKVGQKVEKGQTVAVVGTSGRSTGPHLHFEVLRNGRTVNPRKYLQASR